MISLLKSVLCSIGLQELSILEPNGANGAQWGLKGPQRMLENMAQAYGGLGCGEGELTFAPAEAEGELTLPSCVDCVELGRPGLCSNGLC